MHADALPTLATWSVDLRVGSIALSEGFTDLLDVPPVVDFRSARSLLDFCHPEDRARLDAAMAAGRRNGRRFALDLRVRNRAGRSRWFHVQAEYRLDAAGTATTFSGSLVDIEDSKARESRLVHAASHDALTGLVNRSALLARLAGLLDARDGGREIAVAFVDLDDFKSINDRRGHGDGDRLLQETARRLRSLVRAGDVVARLGGDEFVVLFADVTEPEDVFELVGRIVEHFAHPFDIGGVALPIAASVGVAISGEDGESPEGLLHAADLAMYRAKAAGRNTYRFYRESLQARVAHRTALAAGLRAALDGRAFDVAYEPIARVVDRRIVAYRGQLRWLHPTMGAIAHDNFRTVAESCGLHDAICELARDIVACDVAELTGDPRGGDCVTLCVAENEFRRPHFVAEVASFLARLSCAADAIAFEIPEAVVAADPRDAATTIAGLRDLGTHAIVDRVGSARASPTYLKHLPIVGINLDRALVRDLPEDRGDRALVAGFVAIAHGLGCFANAVGVETEAQIACLRDLGCDRMQGPGVVTAGSAATISAARAFA